VGERAFEEEKDISTRMGLLVNMPDSLFVHQPPPAAASAASAVDPATPRLAASLMCAPLGALCETGAALLPRCADLPAPAGQEHAAALRGKGGGEDTDEDRQAGRERQGERSYWHWEGSAGMLEEMEGPTWRLA